MKATIHLSKIATQMFKYRFVSTPLWAAGFPVHLKLSDKTPYTRVNITYSNKWGKNNICELF